MKKLFFIVFFSSLLLSRVNSSFGQTPGLKLQNLQQMEASENTNGSILPAGKLVVVAHYYGFASDPFTGAAQEPPLPYPLSGSSKNVQSILQTYLFPIMPAEFTVGNYLQNHGYQNTLVMGAIVEENTNNWFGLRDASGNKVVDQPGYPDARNVPGGIVSVMEYQTQDTLKRYRVDPGNVLCYVYMYYSSGRSNLKDWIQFVSQNEIILINPTKNWVKHDILDQVIRRSLLTPLSVIGFCKNASGERVGFSANCQFGGRSPLDGSNTDGNVEGSTAMPFELTELQRRRFDWVTDASVKTIDHDGTYTVYRRESDMVSGNLLRTAASVRGYVIPKKGLPGNVIYIELTSKVSFDKDMDNTLAGVGIYTTVPTGGQAASWPLAILPDPTTGVYQTGEYFNDATTGMSVQIVSVDKDQAVFKVVGLATAACEVKQAFLDIASHDGGNEVPSKNHCSKTSGKADVTVQSSEAIPCQATQYQLKIVYPESFGKTDTTYDITLNPNDRWTKTIDIDYPAADTKEGEATPPGDYSVRFTVTRAGSTTPEASKTFTLSITKNPVPGCDAVVSGFDYQKRVAPGGIAAVFGRNMVTGDGVCTAQYGQWPMQTDLCGVTVNLRDKRGTATVWKAPLFFTSAGQINFQVPFEAGAAAVVIGSESTSYLELQVEDTGAKSEWVSATLTTTGPGLNTDAQTRAVLNPYVDPKTEVIDVYRLVSNSLENPAVTGGFITLFMTGGGMQDVSLAPDQGTIKTGDIPRSGLVYIKKPVFELWGIATGTESRVVISGEDILFAGKMPGFVGTDQINIKVPRNLTQFLPVGALGQFRLNVCAAEEIENPAAECHKPEKAIRGLVIHQLRLPPQ